MKSVILALLLGGNIVIDEIGETALISNTLGFNPPTEVVVKGIDVHGNFMDLIHFTSDSTSGTINMALNSIPYVVEDDILYFEFLLRLNETGVPGSFASLSQFEIVVLGEPFFRLVETSLGTGNGSLPFGSEIIFSVFGPGNNQADASIKLPLSIFQNLDSSLLATIKVTLDNIEAGSDFLGKDEGMFLAPGPIVAGPPPQPPIPEPGRVLLLLLGVLIAVVRRRRWG